MMDELIDQEETVRVCHYCHTKVLMNDSMNDADGLIADKLEVPIPSGNPSDAANQEESNGVEEMAMWLGAGDATKQKTLRQTQLEIGGRLLSNEPRKVEP